MLVSNWEVTVRLLIAAGFGSLVGLERERLLWAAGIRTHMVVCVGACLIMLVSAFGFSDVLAQEHTVLDPSRIAAQVVSGIGFLGAGSILARGEIVRGLTTAASIWTVAAIGLAVGGGMYFAAGASTAIIIGILAGIKPLEEAYRARTQTCELAIEAERGALTPDLTKQALGIRNAQIKRFVAQSSDDTDADAVRITIARVSSQEIAVFTRKLQAIPGVQAVKIVLKARERVPKGR